MPMRFRFDQVDGHRVSDNQAGIEIIRPVLVLDVPISPGESDPSVFLKIIKDAGCPAKGSGYPDLDFSYCKLQERNLRNVRDNSSAILDLIYRGAQPTIGGIIDYTVEDHHIDQQVQTQATADGSQLITVFYKKKFDKTLLNAFPTQRPFAIKSSPIPKHQSSRVIRAVGRSRKDIWNPIRAQIKSLRNHINSVPWGSDPRGTWMFMGPISRYSTGSDIVDIQLDFIEGINGHYPILAYFNRFGDHPADSATEKTIRGAAPPAVNTIRWANGKTIASIYPEVNFNTYFSFTP